MKRMEEVASDLDFFLLFDCRILTFVESTAEMIQITNSPAVLEISETTTLILTRS
jgi:hypothetical protein